MVKKHDRDVLRRSTPAHGVKSQLAPPIGEDWSGDTGTESTPIDQSPISPEEAARLDSEAVTRARARLKETVEIARGVKPAVDETNSGIKTLRMETKAHIEKVSAHLGVQDNKIEALSHQVSDLGGHVLRSITTVGDMSGDLGEVKGKLGELVKAIDNQRDKQTISFEAHVEVDKHAKIADIEDKKGKKSFTRDIWLKIFGLMTSGSLITLIITLLAGRC